MLTKTFKYTSLAINILEKLIGSRFSVSGLENLPDQPIMFVSNHFTRSETFFIPYLIYKHTGKQVRCLADSGLHQGLLGKFLHNVGAISTKNPNRDQIILKDLIKGEYNWLIYPEGSMIKNKEIVKKELFINNTPYRNGAVRTGSAVLALKSQLYRKDIIEANDLKNQDTLNDFEKSLAINHTENLRDLTTYVVPLSITYYPIRPGRNRLELFARKIMEKVSPRFIEELEIEGNLLANAEINIHFGEAINLAKYTEMTRELIYQIPIIKNETKGDFIIKYFRHRLTTDFMSQIYFNVQINLDHIFSACLRHISQNEIKIIDIKRIIYVAAAMIVKTKKYRTNESIKEENLFKLFIDEHHKAFDSILQLAKNIGEIEQIDDETVKINKSFFGKEFDFHLIRTQNTLRVIFNEFSLLEIANNIVKRVCKIPTDELQKKVFDELQKIDRENYEHDYQIYFDKNFSKDKSIGLPFFVNSNMKAAKKIRNTGILLCHGYKSCPQETQNLAKFFSGFGFKVYVVRLKGHGTSPANIKYVTWQDWYDSVQRGYAILRIVCSKIIVVGFSTGGLLALASASQKNKELAGVVSINAALRLNDIRTKIVPTINMWNDILDSLHIEKGKFEYVDDKPENPELNYSRNYLKGVEELGKLMQQCEEILPKITSPALIVQAAKDPIINSISGKMIFEKIASESKMLFEPDFSNHVIINGDNQEHVFASIKEFLHKFNLI